MKKLLQVERMFHIVDGEKVPGRHSRLNGHINGLTGDVTNILGAAVKGELFGDATGCSGSIVGVRGDMTGLNGNVYLLEGCLTDLHGTISKGLEGNVDNVTGDLTGLRGDLTGLDGDLTGIHGYVKDLKGCVTGLEGDVTGLKGDLDACEITREERFAGVVVSTLIALDVEEEFQAERPRNRG
jgi:hypothetical protein